MDFAVTLNLNFHRGRKRVNHGYTYTVQTTGYLVAVTAELTAGMKHRQNDFDSGHTAFVHVYRDTTSIIRNGNAVIPMNRHINLVAVTGQSFVDGVIDNFVYEMMQTTFGSAADIHTRTHTHSLQTFENLNLFSTIIGIYSRYFGTAFIRMDFNASGINALHAVIFILHCIFYIQLFIIICHEILRSHHSVNVSDTARGAASLSISIVS